MSDRPWVSCAYTLLLLVLVHPVQAQQTPRTLQENELAELRTRIVALEAQVARLNRLVETMTALSSTLEPPPPDESPEAEEEFPRVSGDELLPPGRHIPGYPWLLVEEGVLYFQPVPVSKALLSQLRSQQGLETLLDDVETQLLPEGVVELTTLPEDHLLAVLGLRSGDRVITLNDLPLPRSKPQLALFQAQLVRQSRFALELQRGDQRIVAAFYERGAPPAPPMKPIEPTPASTYRLVVASQDSEHPSRNSVVLERHRGGQITLFVGDSIEGYLVSSIKIERSAANTVATMELRGSDGLKTIRLVRD